jgi:phage terminase small subunit
MTADTQEPKRRGRPKGSSKLTVKQEKFLQAYLAKGNAAEAYRKAYNSKGMTVTSIYSESQKLLNHPLISQQLLSRQKRVAERTEITTADLISELEEIQKLALADGKYAPAISALELKAKLMGKVTNRVEGHVTHDHSHAHAHIHRELSEADRWIEGTVVGRQESDAPASGPH